MNLISCKEYNIKESKKAKHVRLKISPRHGLVVVVPQGFDHDRVPDIISNKRHWIEKNKDRIKQQQKFFVPEPPGKVPERILLRAIGQEWAVDYRATEAPWVAAVERKSNRLLVYGDTDNIQACKEALKRWLIRKAHEHIKPWLHQVAEEKGFSIRSVLVKSQKTRWASCSRHRTISLNIKMLFLPQNLIHYIIIHELCHTVQMNHSAKFWSLLRKYEPDFKEKDEGLRIAWRLIPVWIDNKIQDIF